MHEIISKAKDPETGDISKSSNKVNFEIDTEKPLIKSGSIQANFVIVGDSDNNAQVSIEVAVSSDTSTVRFELGDGEYILSTDGNYEQNDNSNSSQKTDFIEYSTYFDTSEEILAKNEYAGTLKIIDEAGNQKVEEIKLQQETNFSPQILGIFDKGVSLITNLVNRFNYLSVVSKANLVFAGFVSLLFAIDAFTLWKLGIIREGAKFLLPAFIFIFAILIGFFVGGGSAII